MIAAGAAGVGGGGDNSGPGSNGNPGSLDLNYSGAITHSGTTLSALSTFNMNAHSYGAYSGGLLSTLLFSSWTNSATSILSCGVISAPGTYIIDSNFDNDSLDGSGNCLVVTADGVTIDGGGRTITGNVNGNGIADGGGYSFSLNNIHVTGSISANGGNGTGSAGGAGGNITISGTNLDITNVNISVEGGNDGCDGSCGGRGTNGTITINYTGTFIRTNATHSALSNLTVNDQDNLPGSLGALFAGGFPVLPGESISQNTGCSLYFARTYVLAESITYNCRVYTGGISINGQNHTITGNVNADGQFYTNGYSLNLSNINITGAVTSDGGSGDNDVTNDGGYTGGNIIIASSVIGSVESNGGGGIYNSPGGQGGNITISTSTIGSISSSGGDSGNNSLPGGAGGNIQITDSIINSVTATGGINSGGSVTGGHGGTVTISGTNLDISTINVSIGGGNDGCDGSCGGMGTNGNLTLTYNDVHTSPSTFFYNVLDLIVNSAHYGPWNGLFNPRIFYFNDNAANNFIEGDSNGDWGDVRNWWFDSNFDMDTESAGSIPTVFDQVIVYRNLTQNSGAAAVAKNVVFNNSNISGFTINASGGFTFNGTSVNNTTIVGPATFNDTSRNNGTTTGITTLNGSALNVGTVINSATTTFNGNLASSSGLVTNAQGATSTPITRIFTQAVTTTRNFITEAGHNNWILVARGAVVNISNAIYSRTTNFFKALLGGSFVTNQTIDGGASVVPQIAINFPVTGTIIKWLTPSVNWDTSVVCAYSYDSVDTMYPVSCINNGSDIPRPSGGEHTLYLDGIDAHGNETQTAGLTFTYDNVSPVWTSCGSDLLDESTRQYYYLNGNVTGNCTASVNTELRGSATTTATTSTQNGYTLTGNIVTSGFNLSLKNITVTGSINASGLHNVSGAGFNGGNITIATSTTHNIVSNGGNGSSNGGNGGIINITNSFGVASSTIIANGGDSTVCGRGGNSGTVTLKRSSYGTITANAGSDFSGLCPAYTNGSSGSGGITYIINDGLGYTSPNVGSGDAGAGTGASQQQSTGGSSVGPGGIFSVLPPVAVIGKLNLKPLPVFGETMGTGKGNNSFSFIDNLNQYLFKLLPSTGDKTLDAYLASRGLIHEQDLVALRKKSILISSKDDVPGIFTVSTSIMPVKTDTGFTTTSTAPLATYLSSSKTSPLTESVTAFPGSTLTIKFTPVGLSAQAGKEKVAGTFNKKSVDLVKTGKTLTTTITLPTIPGTYTFTTPQSPLPLTIIIPRPKIVAVQPAPTQSFWSMLRNIF